MAKSLHENSKKSILFGIRPRQGPCPIRPPHPLPRPPLYRIPRKSLGRKLAKKSLKISNGLLLKMSVLKTELIYVWRKDVVIKRKTASESRWLSSGGQVAQSTPGRGTRTDVMRPPAVLRVLKNVRFSFLITSRRSPCFL
jgi:hypothetical protein